MQDKANERLPREVRPPPFYTTDEQDIELCGSDVRTQNTVVDLLKREVLHSSYNFDPVLSLDAEWRVTYGKRQRIALIQVCARVKHAMRTAEQALPPAILLVCSCYLLLYCAVLPRLDTRALAALSRPSFSV